MSEWQEEKRKFEEKLEAAAHTIQEISFSNFSFVNIIIFSFLARGALKKIRKIHTLTRKNRCIRKIPNKNVVKKVLSQQTKFP